MKKCVGCGYCCMKARCMMAVHKYGASEKTCPALVWDSKAGRYFCKDYEEETWAVIFGWGCVSSLNSWRRNVIKRN